MANFILIYKGKLHPPLFTAYYDGKDWHGNTKISSQPGGISPDSNYSPGTCLFHNRLYMVYPSISDSNALFIAWYDGKKWYGDIKINEMLGNIDPNSDDTPCLVEFQNKMYCLYKGKGNNNMYVAWFDGTTWFGDVKISDMPGNISPKTNHGYFGAVYKERLYIVYKGESSDELYSAWFDGQSWYGNKKINEQSGGINPRSDLNPSPCVYNNRLYIIYKGVTNNQLYTAYLEDETWYGDTAIKNQPQFGDIDPITCDVCPPTSILFDNMMYIVYKGKTDNYLYTAWLDKSTWYGDKKIVVKPDNPPESNDAPIPAIMPIFPAANMKQWLKELNDNLLLSDISLPGTHDTAAISKGKILDKFYSCQYDSIKSQLENGIRLLDIRIKVKKVDDQFVFVTCHGNLPLNEYQSLSSAFDECRDFLSENPSEVLVMSLKIDDYQGYSLNQFQQALVNLITSYPVIRQPTMPTLGKIRGFIYLVNRISSNLLFGVPIPFPDNPTGVLILSNPPVRQFQVYLQDKYNFGVFYLNYYTVQEEKWQLFKAAFDKKVGEITLINFASAVYNGNLEVDIQKPFINFIGQTPVSDRPKNLGWCLFDFATQSYALDTSNYVNCIQLIVDANFGYTSYDYFFKTV